MTVSTMKAGRGRKGRIALAIVFALFAANAAAQVVFRLSGGSDDPAALTGLQVLVAVAGSAAAWGSWSGARWAHIAALCYGLATATLLATLPGLLDLPSDARAGIWSSAAGVLVFGIWAAWYLRPSAWPPSA